ncbi:MAG TPA: RagB/SusD family nutrient uptake outer membrane protein [Prolixibacteraceae bacterium]|nr:RagB/SusD family nutrient uptake outer membrane protein [Prolixibacteraceae bacterium]
MKNIIFNISAIAFLLLFFASCEENVLDKKAVDTFNEELVFSDIDVVNAYLGKCYDRMGGNDDAGILGAREDLLASGTDQLLCIHRPASYVMLKGTMSPDQLGFFEDTGKGGYLRWYNLYSNIQDINRILANIDPVPAVNKEALKIQMKGEAFFIRAFDYSTLLMVYGGAILHDTPYSLNDDFSSEKRASIKETLDFILKDIQSAIDNLPASVEQGRANPAAAAALRSRVLLFCASKLTNGGWAEQASNTLISFPAGSQTALLTQARDAAKEIMDGNFGTFALVGTTSEPASPLTAADVQTYADNYFSIFNQKGQWNSETIWGIQFPLTGGNVNNANIWYGPNGYHNWGNNDPTEASVRKFEMADGSKFQWDKYNPGNLDLRTATAAELTADPLRNPYNGREPRFYACVLYDGAPWQARPADAAGLEPENKIQTGYYFHNEGDAEPYKSGLDTRQGLIEAWNGQKTGYNIRKLLDPETAGQYFKNTNTWVEFRYAEILMNYAEACIELGGSDLQNGIDAMNMVRRRAGLPSKVTSDQAEARQFVRDERNVEFFAEGHRFYDIRRWMIADQVIEPVFSMRVEHYDTGLTKWIYNKADKADDRSFTNNKFYWVPLSRDEMNKAPQLIQNPGYE